MGEWFSRKNSPNAILTINETPLNCELFKLRFGNDILRYLKKLREMVE